VATAAVIMMPLMGLNRGTTLVSETRQRCPSLSPQCPPWASLAAPMALDWTAQLEVGQLKTTRRVARPWCGLGAVLEAMAMGTGTGTPGTRAVTGTGTWVDLVAKMMGNLTVMGEARMPVGMPVGAGVEVGAAYN
jgi:hypothetical protein